MISRQIVFLLLILTPFAAFAAQPTAPVAPKLDLQRDYNGICEDPWIANFPNDPADSPIDKSLADCLARGEASDKCYQTATNRWDKQLNIFYQALLSSPHRGQKEILQDSQRQWLKHRDLELKYFATLLENSEGSMYPALYSNYQMTLIRNRALELQQTLAFLCTEI